MSIDPKDEAARGELGRQLAGLHDARGLLEGMFLHSPVPYVIFDADGHFVLGNPAYREMFGRLPPPEYNVLTDEVAARLGIAEPIRRAFAGETIKLPTVWYDPKELEHVRVDDVNRVAIACTFFPLRDASGAVAQVAIAYKDVTAELSAREQAEATADRLSDTLDAAEVGTWEWRLADNQVSWSSNIERIFGLAAGTFAGTYEAWLALVHPDDRGWMAERVRAALDSGGAYKAEFRFLRPDGSIGWQSTRGRAVTDASGKAIALRGTVVDVTARRTAEIQLELSETRYRSFVAQSTEGIWRCEVTTPIPIDLPVAEQIDRMYRDGVMAECNDAMARMYGFESAAVLVGARLSDLLVREDAKNEAYLSAFVESGYRLQGGESVELDRHGQRRVFENSLVGVIEDGKLVRAWGTQRDVTAQVEAREAAEAANRAKDEFLAMLGHELRNPLSPIITALDLMRMREQGAYQNERAIIERQVRHVVRLVDDLLDVARIVRGKVALDQRPIQLVECIAGALELASPLIEQRAHQVTVRIPNDVVVRGDPTRLGQVFANLFTNAAKYTPPGGRIEIVGETDGDGARVTVSDSGVGIRPEMLPRVFEPFVQERQALDRSDGGLGVGLAIVRSLVALHGGQVHAHSDGEGRGSRFVVELPLASERDVVAARVERPEQATPPERRRILVVDDNGDAAETLAEALRALGHEVQVAFDGPSALGLVQSFAPEVGLLDIGLPVMDGFELARRIRELQGYAAVPLIAVTGYGQLRDREAAKAAGFDELLVKPVGLTVLAALVSSLSSAVPPEARQ